MSNIKVGKTAQGAEVSIASSMLNRHGLIAGATGTGKTVTLQSLAEQISATGAAVFMADVKGDLSGIAKAAAPNSKIGERIAKLGMNFTPTANPVLLWDIFAKSGHAVRTTLSEVGPILLARVLQLNEIQTQALQVAFAVADSQGLLLLDIKDLRALLNWMEQEKDAVQEQFGSVAPATIATIQRTLSTINIGGGDKFFGEPALQIQHLLQRDFSGRGVINVLDATQLLSDQRMYSTFLLWLLSELFEQLPEVGDQELPKLVFFFDEAHLLFKDISNTLSAKIDQVVRLIRSKGVGVYFVTQNPADIPDSILAQLGLRIQHALRAYTPAEQKLVKAAARSFRVNPVINTEKEITELEVGEALVSTLDANGRPTQVERIMIYPPQSRLGPLSVEERSEILERSPLKGIYDSVLERESAFEMLKARHAQLSEGHKAKDPAGAASENTSIMAGAGTAIGKVLMGDGKRQGLAEALFKSVVRSLGGSLGREIMRGVLGNPRRR